MPGARDFLRLVVVTARRAGHVSASHAARARDFDAESRSSEWSNANRNSLARVPRARRRAVASFARPSLARSSSVRASPCVVVVVVIAIVIVVVYK